METYLAPIENPQDPALKAAYAYSEQTFGKVITPFKVLVARLGMDFAQFYGKIGELDQKLTLPKETVMLARLQVARLNVCEFCMDIKRWEIIHTSMNAAKFDALDQYSTSALFNEKEKALLDYVTELTRDKKMSPATFKRLAAHFNEREICEIVYLISTEHIYNVGNIGLNIHSDMLCDISRKK
jgi:alkylhydroperoxidase family enzyme